MSICNRCTIKCHFLRGHVFLWIFVLLSVNEIEENVFSRNLWTQFLLSGMSWELENEMASYNLWSENRDWSMLALFLFSLFYTFKDFILWNSASIIPGRSFPLYYTALEIWSWTCTEVCFHSYYDKKVFMFDLHRWLCGDKQSFIEDWYYEVAQNHLWLCLQFHGIRYILPLFWGCLLISDEEYLATLMKVFFMAKSNDFFS